MNRTRIHAEKCVCVVSKWKKNENVEENRRPNNNTVNNREIEGSDIPHKTDENGTKRGQREKTRIEWRRQQKKNRTKIEIEKNWQ